MWPFSKGDEYKGEEGFRMPEQVSRTPCEPMKQEKQIEENPEPMPEPRSISGKIRIKVDNDGEIWIDKGTGAYYPQDCVDKDMVERNEYCSMRCPMLQINKHNIETGEAYSMQGCKFRFTCDEMIAEDEADN